MTRALLILVCYENELEVADFCRLNRSRFQSAGVEVLIVVNATVNPAVLESLGLELPEVLIFLAPRNLGYLGGARFGLERYLAIRAVQPAWFIVMNSDVAFTRPDFFEVFFQKAAGADVAAPAVFSTLSKFHQNPFSDRPYPVSRLRFLRRVFSFYPSYLLYQCLAYIKRAFRSARNTGQEPRSVYALHGTFLAFHRRYFEKGGSLDFKGFLFGEELYVAEQVKSIQGECRYIPELTLEHREHASTGRFKSPGMVKYMKESTDYLIREVYRG
ncbi:MAG: hypothetical protein JNN19_12835 [Bacteroidia bacterium]|nr:hypothetical protein [Bacteroidia bacterium]